MGLFDRAFGSKPKYVTDTVAKIKAHLIDVNPKVRRKLEAEAIFYAEKEGNRARFERNIAEGKDAEYHALLFISLGARDLLLRGEFHIYAGVASPEGNIACAVACDCLDRLTRLGYYDEDTLTNMKNATRALLTDIGIG